MGTNNLLKEIQNPNELIELSQRKEKDQTIIYHYTTYESLLAILENKCFRLSRSDLLNDKVEEKFSGCLESEKRYIMSFTYTGVESVAMWAMYGKASGIKLRIGIPHSFLVKTINNNFYFDPKKDNKIGIGDVETLSPTKKEFRVSNVMYYDKEADKIFLKKYTYRTLMSENDSKQLAGFVKYNVWDFEKEIRLSVLLNSQGENKTFDKYIYAGITDELISEMIITYNPWIKENVKREIERSINSIPGFELKHEFSKCHGEVSEL